MAATIAAAIGFTPSAVAESLEVAPNKITRGDKVVAVFSLTPKENEGGWVGLFRKGDPDDRYITYKKVDEGINRWEIPMTEPGEYQLRMFKDYFGQKKGAIVGFSVVAQHGSMVSPDKTSFGLGEKITARYTIVPPDDQDKSGYVGVYSRDRETGKQLSYKKTGGASGTWEIDIPLPAGTYELRLYQDYYGQRLIATSAAFSVGRSGGSSITLAETQVRAKQKVTVRFSIAPPDDQDTSGWIGLFARGAPNDRAISYHKTGGRSGTWDFVAEVAPGTYELRMFQDYFGQRLIAVSRPLEILEEVSDPDRPVAPGARPGGDRGTTAGSAPSSPAAPPAGAAPVPPSQPAGVAPGTAASAPPAPPRQVTAGGGEDRIGQRLTVIEGDWRGEWTRVPGSKTFDATWRHARTGDVAHDRITIETVRDEFVVLHRHGMNGRYFGALSCDGRSIVGTTSWYPPGMVWQATIH